MRFFFPALVLFFVFVAQGCASRVCREQAVYEMEISFMEQGALRSATALEKFIRSDCECKDGKFVTKTCEDSARTVLVVKTRFPWHKAMMLHNAGIVETMPDEIPPIPAPETLCPGNDE